MNSLGFQNVVNRNEDFWSMQANNTIPNYDVCVTNPPYSDHDKERTVKFIVDSKKPGFVLLPSYCGNKTWLKRASAGQQVFVVRPKIDYQYAHIEHRGHATSPFHSSWFCFNVRYDIMSRVSPLVRHLAKLEEVGVSFVKRLSSKRRKAMKRKAMGGGGCT